MNDDETGEVIKRTDLSPEAPTERAAWSPHLVEKSTFKASKDGVEVTSESSPGSVQNKAQTTLYLTVAFATVTLIAAFIHIPAAAALATGLGVTIILYLLIHFTPGRRKKG